MSIHVKGINMGSWKVINNGDSLVVGTTGVPLTDAQVKENERLKSLDAKVMSIMYCGLNKNEYNLISLCITAQQIWTRLEVTHEGTSEVKMHRICMLL